jgi:hypothetical protein
MSRVQHDAYNPCALELLSFTEVHQRHTEALARATGEHFNIFQILRVGHLEVKTHSPILGELLNPNGHHGQGPTFLHLFVSKFKIKGFDADSETATMELEHHVRQVEEKSSGRIDIVVKDGKGATIFIENKIYAGDQEDQLERYRNSDKEAHLFYLTLDGREPSNLSAVQLEGIQCECISYNKDVLTWLKDCRKEAACLPGVRETISQYIHLIEELTNQSTTARMNNELITEILKTKEKHAAFYTLYEGLEAVRATLIARLDAELGDIANAKGLTRGEPIRDLYKKNHGFYFRTKGLEQRNLQIGFAFDKNYYGDFYFGFAKISDKQPCPVEAQLLAALKEKFPEAERTDAWPASAYWEEPYRNWKQEAFEAIRSRQFEEDLKSKLDMLTQIARQICPDEGVTQTG